MNYQKGVVKNELSESYLKPGNYNNNIIIIISVYTLGLKIEFPKQK